MFYSLFSCGTEPDNTYNINYLSRLQSLFGQTHFKYAFNFIKYLYHIKNHKRVCIRKINVDVMEIPTTKCPILIRS